MSILIFLLPILAKLQTKFFRHFYRIGFNFYKWWTGPPIRITKHIRDFAKSIEPDEWEWKADAKSGGEEHFRFELSDWSSRDSLHIDIVSRATQIEARLILWHQGETFDSGTLISRETDDIHTIRCGPLLLDVREPFRRCRFFYRGEIRNSQNEPIFLSIGGWFKPTSDVRFFYSNLQVNEEILKNPWRILSNFRKFNKQREQKDFVQWGEAFCEIEMNRVAVRRRFRGLKEVRRLSANDREDQISVYFEDGHRYFWRSEDRAQYNSHLEHGIHSHVDQIVRSISLDTPEGVYQPDSLSILKFKTNQGQEESFTKMKHLNKCSYERDDGVTIVVNRFECDRKGSIGYAFISSIIQPLDKKECKQRVEAILDYKAIGLERILRIIPLTHRACQDSSLTGGKGSNLGKLSTIRCKYQVPNGFVISTNAYEEHLKANKALSQLINRINHNLKIDELESLLKKIEAAFHESELTLAMRTELEIVLRNEFAEKLLAIRSSAIGEDGADLSSAGQLESQLNIQPKDVQQTLKRVWASNFRKEVYSYRKFYAQLLTPSMAIVVQEMISNGTAGVMFTCNPVTRDPTKFLINAHQGMGEEIVSGAVTPHTALIAKHNGEILEKSEEILCLEDSQLLELTKVGHFLETHFGKPQDVEFVIKNEVIYLVQSRDVTGLDRESDFELSTEFDSGNLTDHEIYTTANVGEVLPRPLTPLGISVEAQLYEKALCKMFFSFGSTHIPMHHHMAFHITNNRVFFNVGELYLRQWVVLEKDPLSEYTLAGERMISTEMYRQGKLRYKPSHPLFPIYRLGYMIHATLWGGKSTLKTVEFGSKAIQELVSDGKAQRQLENIQQQQELFAKLIYNHSYISSCSSFTYIIVAMLIRGSPEGDLTPEMLSDIATLFGNNSLSVISADVPNALKNIAKAITKSKVQPEFETLEGEFALKLLFCDSKTEPLVTEFFEKHGHRGPFELDIYATEWSKSPELLVHTLKTMLKDPKLNDERVEEAGNLVDVLDQLKNKPKGIARSLMQYMVKQTHQGVSNRENAKNLLVKANVAIRNSIRLLADELHKEGILTDKDLVYYLTLVEIRELLKTRSPRFIARLASRIPKLVVINLSPNKAMRRRQHFPAQSEHKYRHVTWGCVEPEAPVDSMKFKSLAELKGTPVCEGRVVAKARVAKNLEEAKETKTGEILITCFTDICWSPFFPIIHGLVTEIGGLLSHGAVVAREYGLPSLIAVQHATEVFKTGDLVELDSFEGVIRKLEMNDIGRE